MSDFSVKVLLIPLVLTGFLHSSGSPPDPPEAGVAINWETELISLGRELALRHPELYHRTDSAAFFEGLQNLARRSGGDSVFEISVRLQQYLAATVDPATRVNYHFQVDPQQILPLKCYWFDEGLVVLECREGFEKMLGRHIIGVNGFPIGRVVDSFRTVIGNPTPSRLKREVPRMLTWNQLLVHFGFSGRGSVVLETRGPSGGTDTCRISLPARDREMLSVRPDSLPLGWRNQNKYFWHSYMADRKTCYIQYNKCWSRESEEKYGTGASALFMPLFRDFEKSVLKTLRRNEIRNVVLDLRFNDGGHPAQGHAFIKELANSKSAADARFYLLVGRQTDSEALENAMDAVRLLDPLVVGEPTPTPPNHFGHIRRFVMTTSRIVVNYPTRYIRLMEASPPAIQPDVQISWSFSEYMKGIDPALKEI